jgi:glutaminase A
MGATASYIPALKNADPSKLGVCLVGNNGEFLTAGDAETPFSIQSIVKIIIFACCLLDSGKERVAEKVSVEPTNDGFNAIINLETKNANKPLNPMINAGAIACLTLVSGETFQEKSDRILQFARRISDNPTMGIDEEIYLSEKRTGSRNRALSYYMQSTGILDAEVNVEDLLDSYFRACSITVTCVDLARMAQVFANNGQDARTGEVLFPKALARAIKATMVMCGMYNESGGVAVRIGLPTKSGVGGGILSLIPEVAGIGIYGPALNEAGSSIAGLALLERISTAMDASIF